MSTATAHVTPGSTAGVVYQFERALFRLATAPGGSVIGIETLDDISVVDETGNAILEQDKHSIQTTGHPFGARSKALWNTLLIWLKGIADGEPYISAELHLVTNRPVPEDCLARRFGKADKSGDEIAGCIAELREAGQNPAETNASLFSEVMTYEDDALGHVIRRIRLFDASNQTAGTDLRKAIISALHIADGISGKAVLDSLAGWLQRITKDLWDHGQPAWIARQAFSNQLHAIINRQKQQRTRETAARYILVSDTERESARTHNFVEHLALVHASEEAVLQAIDDYIMFNAERSRLVREGDITEEDWDDRADRLHRRWNYIHERNVDDAAPGDEEKVGRRILWETIDHKEPLANEDTYEGYLTAGHYHRLANSDTVWWYPAFNAEE